VILGFQRLRDCGIFVEEEDEGRHLSILQRVQYDMTGYGFSKIWKDLENGFSKTRFHTKNDFPGKTGSFRKRFLKR